MHAWLAVVLYGIIEGVTEFLPISSTAHLLIAEHWLPHQSDLFLIVIQSGAVLAVLPIFPERLHQFFFRWRERETQDYLLKIVVAFGLTGIGGLMLDHYGFKLPENLGPIAWALLWGGVLFVVIELWIRGRPLSSQITWAMVVFMALGQLLAAVFPGVSRSGGTIMFMLILGLSRPAAVEYSFLVGIPTMLSAGGLKIYKAVAHPVIGAGGEHWGMVLLGFIVSAAVSFVVVKWLLNFIRSHTFMSFGWYRIALAAVLFGVIYL